MELPCDVFFVTNVSTTLISYKWDCFYWTSPNQNLYFWTLFWLRSSPIRLKEVTLTYSFPKFVRLVFWPKNRKTEEIRSLFRSSRPVQDLTKFILEKKILMLLDPRAPRLFFGLHNPETTNCCWKSKLGPNTSEIQFSKHGSFWNNFT